MFEHNCNDAHGEKVRQREGEVYKIRIYVKTEWERERMTTTSQLLTICSYCCRVKNLTSFLGSTCTL